MSDTPLIAEGQRFEGLLAFRGPTLVEGRLRGEVVGEGRLELGEKASVHGSIEVDELVVSGHIDGEVRARKRIELRPSARVVGVLRAPRVALAEGCFLRGRCESGAAG